MKLNWKLGVGIGVAMLALVIGIGYSHGNTISKVADFGKEQFGIVSNTEYWSGETGSIIARLVDAQGNPVTVLNCTAKVTYPNETYFIAEQLMSASTIAGDHYTTFTVPETEGVYDYAVTCLYLQGAAQKTAIATKTFHVSPALNEIAVISATDATILTGVQNLQINVSNTYADTQYIRSNMVLDTAFQSNMTQLNTKIDDVQGDVTTLLTYCNDAVTNASALCQLVYQIDAQVAAIDISTLTTQLNEINSTTWNTYDYMTGTLASNVNTILQDVGIIKTTTNQINSTVNIVRNDTLTILANQQDAVNLVIIS